MKVKLLTNLKVDQMEKGRLLAGTVVELDEAHLKDLPAGSFEAVKAEPEKKPAK